MHDSQLILNVKSKQNKSFANFICAPKNKELITLLKSIFNTHHHYAISKHMKSLHLHGQHNSGKTHILHSICSKAQQQRLTFLYIPMRESVKKEPHQILGNIETYDIVCIDDIDAISGHRHWQEALFHTYNKVTEHNNKIFTSSQEVIKDSNIALNDLTSRLSWGLTFRMHKLDEQGLSQLLESKINSSGLTLSSEVKDYILMRAPRTIDDILYIIKTLDTASWHDKRSLTKPFVKEILNW
jgi:DnaA-homolog protein